MIITLTVRCPKCMHKMKYQSMTSTVEKKSKRCVYCGKSFSIRKNVVSV